jgi:protein-tyrosine phosphatase
VKTKKILIVCAGNLCISPLTQGILDKKIKEHNLDVSIDSAGIEPHHIMQAPDAFVTEFAQKKDINIANHRMRLFTQHDFDTYDKILVSGHRALKHINFLTRNKNDKKKTKLLMNIIIPGINKSIPMPKIGEEAELEDTFKLLSKICDQILVDIKAEA